MTPQEALAQALSDLSTIDHPMGLDWDGDVSSRSVAAAILDALPEGWVLGQTSGDFYPAAYDDGMTAGAQQERERLRALNDANDPPAEQHLYAVRLLADPEPDR